MDDNSLNRYLDDIGRGKLLSQEEEQRLAHRIKAGDDRALHRLVEANLRFVVKIAAQYRSQGLQLDDLISEGNIGLMKAAAKFDGDRGTRFVSYAAPLVRHQIERAVEQFNGLYREQQSAPKASGSGFLSVDAPLGGRTNMSLLSVLVNKDAPMADERVYSEAIEQAVEFALLTLSEREARVVNGFFGLDREAETMAELAADLGVKRERVRQIRDRAVRRLRKAYRHKLSELRDKK